MVLRISYITIYYILLSDVSRVASELVIILLFTIHFVFLTAMMNVA